MSDNATQPTEQPVEDFLAKVEPEQRRTDGYRLLELMAEVTGEAPTMWGASIVGFGQRHYAYASGREGEWMRVGYSPRKTQLSLYGLQDHPSAPDVLERLGPHSTGAGCVYVKRLDAINENVLRELIDLAYRIDEDD